MESQRDKIFQKLLEKTQALGRQVTFPEMEEDVGVLVANEYAFYYGSFSDAAKEAWDIVRHGGDRSKRSLESRKEGVNKMSRRHRKSLSPEREEEVLNEIVDMFIESGGLMPSNRMVKKNRYISEEEVRILRTSSKIREPEIRRRAEEKTGKKFLSPEARRKKKASEAKKQVKTDPVGTEKEKLVKEYATELAEMDEAKAKALFSEEEIVGISETKEEEKMARSQGTTATAEEIRGTLRQFGMKYLRWPTDKEIHEFSQNNEPGWASSAHIYRQLGSKSSWAEQVFPEGLPEGFVERRRGERVTEMTSSNTGSDPKAVKPAAIDASAETVANVKPAPETELFDSRNGMIEVTVGEMKISIPVVLTVPKGVAISGTVQLVLPETE